MGRLRALRDGQHRRTVPEPGRAHPAAGAERDVSRDDRLGRPDEPPLDRPVRGGLGIPGPLRMDLVDDAAGRPRPRGLAAAPAAPAGPGDYRVRILVTGAAGFINGYLVPELLDAGHEVIGVDDFSKYGRITKSYDGHPRYRFVEGDAKDAELLRDLATDCDQVVAAAAMIG